MFDLSGKTALVTGATGGIGNAIAKALHAQGAVVGISGRNEAKLNELAAELGDRVHVLPADLGDLTQIDALVKAATEAMGKIDILVNNAGLTKDNLSLRMKQEEWDEVIRVNLTATFLLAQACQRGMMKARWGRVINISSVVGTTGNPGQCNYVASKAGLAGWTKAMAAEIASRNVTVNCIAPGFIATPMTDVLTDDQKTKINSTIPMGRMGTPDDIAAACVYLASEEAAYVTGQTIHVNGGMAMV
ncbi:MAG: 3-oxoacyl-[acyl-carrier-protein] reductase [Micavibrio aeruginosavorus]|nr:3-oxoacyl-[acyl-carrier-protein] reductase [Micavibrio aeruginosavorus]